MKTSIVIIAMISLVTFACSTQKKVTATANDDVYDSPNRAGQPTAKTTTPQTTGAQIVTSPDQAKVQKSNSSSFADDYNDYSYAGRIDRFNNKDILHSYELKKTF